MIFSATVNVGTRVKCWVTIPIPRRMASFGELDLDILAVDRDLALIRRVQPVQDAHQGGLAGPVFAQQSVDFPWLQVEIDLVVGNQRSKPLGNAFHFNCMTVRSL